MNHYDDISELMNELQAADLLHAPVPDLIKLRQGYYYAVLHASNWYRCVNHIVML